MSTDQKNAGTRFWAWIVFAFIMGAVVGLVVGAGTVIVLVAMTGYAP